MNRIHREPRLAWARGAILAAAALLPWMRFLGHPYAINLDVSWFYYVARGMLHGGVLYKDYIEPNAPFSALTMMPAVAMARLFATSPALAVEIYVTLIAGAILVVVAFCLRVLNLRSVAQLWCLALLGFMFAFLPDASFGQREHITLMLVAPYTVLCIAAWHGRRPGVRLACVVGLAAAYAAGMKPPLLLVPAFMEAALLVRIGPRRWWRPQLWALMAGGSAIGLCVVVFFPLYPSAIIPWAVAIYDGYDQKPQVAIWVLYCSTLALLGYCLLGFARDDDLRAARAILLAGFMGGIGAYAMQAKGWFYQLIPAYGFMAALLAASVAGIALRPAGQSAGPRRWLLCTALALVFAVEVFHRARLADQPMSPASFAGVSQAIGKSAGPFMIFSTSVDPGFPLAVTLGKVWASRYPCMLMLPAIVRDTTGKVAARWERVYRREIVEDMRRYRPSLVMVPIVNTQALPNGFSILAWLLRDPDFTSIWGSYVRRGDVDDLAVFQLK